MPVTRTWVTGEMAVNQFDRFALGQGWVFTSVPQQRDFGKDGYLDVTDEGEFDGTCVAIQVKGGRSLRVDFGYEIRANMSHRRMWMGSPLPVIAVAWDPDSNECFWIDARAELRKRGVRGRIVAPLTNHLAGKGIDAFGNYVRLHGRAEYGLVALGSLDANEQAFGCMAALSQGRHDPRPLVLLRRCLVSLDEEAIPDAVLALSHVTPHPDIYWGRHNTIDTDVKRQVEGTFRWTPDEVVVMLNAIEVETGVDRGSVGQCVYMLLAVDAQIDATLRDAIGRAVQRDQLHAAAWGLCLAVYWAGDEGRSALDSILKAWPRLRASSLVPEVEAAVVEFGYVTLD